MMAGPDAEFFPSLLDRLTERGREEDTARRLEKELAGIEHRLSHAEQEGVTRTERHRLQNRRRELLARLDLLHGLTRTWDDIRECVRRDLDWLFNAHAFSPSEWLEPRPETRRSVLNYGLPDLSGRTATGIDVQQLEHRLEEVIAAFEPRILRRTLRVRLDLEASDLDHNSLMLEIQGELWALPTPYHLRLRSRLDLDEDVASVIEFQA